MQHPHSTHPSTPSVSASLETLGMWHKVLTRMMQGSSIDLSARQLGILLSVYLNPGPHSLKTLANELRIPKAAICRAIDALSADGLVRRRKDETDRRRVYVQRTVKGSVYLSDFAEVISAVVYGGTKHPAGVQSLPLVA